MPGPGLVSSSTVLLVSPLGESRSPIESTLISVIDDRDRFSTHPAIALPSLQPWEYGNVFIARAKSMLGSMLSVPSRETVIAFILLAHCGFANDSESEVWMNTGLAVRMSYELGLQIVSLFEPPHGDQQELMYPQEYSRVINSHSRRPPSEQVDILVSPAHGLRPGLWSWSTNRHTAK